jgi:signal transduction histidine kinase
MIENVSVGIFIGVVIFSLLILFIFLLIRLFIKKTIQQRLISIQQQEAFNLSLMESSIAIKEQTLTNISEEIHDNIGQVLTLAKLELNTINVQHQKIDSSIEHISKAITDLRSLSKSMHSNAINSIGIAAALQLEADKLTRTGQYAVTYKAPELAMLDDKKTIILFRMFQEIINNIIKHARATSINITLTKLHDKHLMLQVQDNGIGFEAEHVSKSVGMQSLSNRAKILNGTFNIESKPQSGTVITIQIPI